MNKKFTKLIAAVALLVFMAPSLVGWGQTKITDYNNIVSGTSYYIGATTSNTDYYLYVDGSVTSQSIAGTAKTSMSEATPFIFEGSGSTWTIKFDDNNGYYLSLKNSKDNGKVQVVEDPANFVASNQNNSKIRLTIMNGQQSGSYSIQKNNSGTQFGSYANTQTDIWLIAVPSYHTLTITQPDGGSIAVTNANNETVNSGDEIAEDAELTIVATPNASYAFNEWSVSGTGSSVNDASAATTTFTMGTDDATLTASFVLDANEYEVGVAPGIADGQIDADPTLCVSGTEVTLTITPDNGYHIGTLTVTGNDSGDAITISPAINPNVNEYTFNMPAEDVTVNGTFTNTFTDELTADLIGVTSYSDWSGISSNSSAEYAGNTTKGSNAIQMRSTNNSGIVSTTSGGLAKKVVITWNSNTQTDRTLNVYGKNTAYTSAADLYDDATAGTLIGTIVKGTSTELTISPDYNFIGMCSNSGAMYLDEIDITWAPDDNPAVPTTVTIDASGITNTNAFISTEAGALSATVKDNQENIIDNATVTWESSDTDVATITENGAITLVATGTTTITASYAGVENQYRPSSATYELTVNNFDPNAPGTINNPYTVAQARAAIDANTGINNVYVTGTVYQNDGYNTTYHSITYWICDDPDDTSEPLEVYSGKSFNGNNFTDGDDIQEGDVVVVYGNLKKHTDGTYEFNYNNQLVSLNRPITGTASYDDLEIPAGETFTVENGGILTLTGTPDIQGNLIIEDGGQLIHNDGDVYATLQKNITNYSKLVANGWYTIASPVDGASVDPLTTDEYDLYSYTESNHKWYNQKAHTSDFTTLTLGQGYLYANSVAKELSFSGTMLDTDTEFTVPLSYTSEAGVLKGANLVGNPFTCNITYGKVKMDGVALTSYLVVENDTELKPSNLETDDIKPGQGFFVQLPESHTTTNLVFNPTGKGETDAKPAFVRIEAGDASFMDRAYVQIGQGNTLRKMSINEEVPHLYVLNNGADYAAATIEAAEGEMPVCFTTTRDGQYDITVSAKGFETDYLHLIDNLTGNDIDLLINPSYSFEAKAGDNAYRFRLVFGEQGSSTSSETFAFISNGDIIINGVDADATLQMVDMTGRIILSKNGVHSLSTSEIPAGVYVLRVINGKEIMTQKMVIR